MENFRLLGAIKKFTNDIELNIPFLNYYGHLNSWARLENYFSLLALRECCHQPWRWYCFFYSILHESLPYDLAAVGRKCMSSSTNRRSLSKLDLRVEVRRFCHYSRRRRQPADQNSNRIFAQKICRNFT